MTIPRGTEPDHARQKWIDMSRLKGIWSRSFTRDEHGAVTVDWIVLTAAIVFLGIGAGFLVAGSIPGLADGIANFLDSRDPGSWNY